MTKLEIWICIFVAIDIVFDNYELSEAKTPFIQFANTILGLVEEKIKLILVGTFLICKIQKIMAWLMPNDDTPPAPAPCFAVQPDEENKKQETCN